MLYLLARALEEHGSQQSATVTTLFIRPQKTLKSKSTNTISHDFSTNLFHSATSRRQTLKNIARYNYRYALVYQLPNTLKTLYNRKLIFYLHKASSCSANSREGARGDYIRLPSSSMHALNCNIASRDWTRPFPNEHGKR